MVFTTVVFAFYFFPILLGVYFLAPRRLRNAFLTVASYVFYGWWNPWFVLLMFGTTVVDYYCGKLVVADGASLQQKKVGVGLSVVSNVALLGFFKYAGLFTETVNSFLGLVNHQGFPVFHILLPVGISFYTFQSMSYCIDLYRNDAPPARSLLDFMTYVSLFPHLVAGPIVRYRLIADALRDRRETLRGVARGLCYFAIGFGKKIMIANPLGTAVDQVFGAHAPAWHLAWFGATAYGFQMYFDFSGYSDMAIGLGHILGFNFPQNFNSPFHSESITDFWRRWHISLSTWLRDYLYLPLGGNRLGKTRTYFNLFVTMLIGGLWHGAQWRFVIWGGMHGVLLAVERAFGKKPLYAALPRYGRIAMTFVILIFLNWVVVRSSSLAGAARFAGSMLGAIPSGSSAPLLSARVYSAFNLFVFGLAVFFAFIPMRTQDFVDAPSREAYRYGPRMVVVIGLLTISFVEMFGQSLNPFLYTQF